MEKRFSFLSQKEIIPFSYTMGAFNSHLKMGIFLSRGAFNFHLKTGAFVLKRRGSNFPSLPFPLGDP
jgi:hypothetical protein